MVSYTREWHQLVKHESHMTNGNYKVVIPKSGKIYSQNSCIDGTDISESIEIKQLKNMNTNYRKMPTKPVSENLFFFLKIFLTSFYRLLFQLLTSISQFLMENKGSLDQSLVVLWASFPEGSRMGEVRNTTFSWRRWVF